MTVRCRTQLPRAELLIGAALVEHRHDLSLCDQVRLHKFLRARVSRPAFRVIADAMAWPVGSGPIYRQLDPTVLRDNADRRARLNLDVVPGVNLPKVAIFSK